MNALTQRLHVGLAQHSTTLVSVQLWWGEIRDLINLVAHPKFIQLTMDSEKGILYALDASGRVWWSRPSGVPGAMPEWQALTTNRKETLAVPSGTPVPST